MNVFTIKSDLNIYAAKQHPQVQVNICGFKKKNLDVKELSSAEQQILVIRSQHMAEQILF